MDLETLKGKSYAVIKPHRTALDDRVWGEAFGMYIDLPGGCEIEIDDDRLEHSIRATDGIGPFDTALVVPAIVRDPYLPPLCIVLSLADLSTLYNEIEKGSGPRIAAGRKRCTHPETNPPTARCSYCLWRWWTARERTKETE